MAVIGYLRVSTDEQAASGNGLNGQLDACEHWCSRNGTELAAYHQDDVGGASGLDKRPGLLAAISELKRGDILLVSKRDRLSRADPVALAMVESAIVRKGARLVSAAGEGTDGNSPTDILMRRMVDAFAEYERLVIGARTKSALQAKIVRRERVGEIRFGFDLAADGITLIENPQEQQVIGLIHELRDEGLSLRKIAVELTTRRIATKKRNKKWTHQSVERILKRAA